jgi:hypothetical protein
VSSDAFFPRARASRVVRSFLALLTLGLAPRPAAAQRIVSTLDVGGASLRYADSVSATAATMSPTVRADWARATLAASGTASQLRAGGWSTQGTLDGSVFTPAAGPLLGELVGSAGGSAHQDGTRTGQTLAVGRAHLLAARGGVWGGAGLGQTWDGAVWRVVRVAEAGAWAHAGIATALAALTPTAVDDTLHYTDATVSLRVDLARVDLGASAGLRAGQRFSALGGSARSWGGASATIWLAERLALVAGTGTYPVDLTQGFPGGRYASLGIRLASGEARRAAPASGRGVNADRRAGYDAPAGTDRRVLTFEVASATGGRRTLRVHAPSAAGVEVAGDFSAWQPIPLSRAGGGWWTVTLPVSRGTHQVNLRVDGGPWRVPPGLGVVADEFGGTVGLLVIE